MAKKVKNATATNELPLSVVIQKKETIINTIHADMDRIRNWNEVIDGTTRDFDIKALYNAIIQNEKELIKIKTLIQFANLGIPFSNEVSKKSNYPLVYELNNLKERLDFLNMDRASRKFLPCRQGKIKNIVYSSILTEDFILQEKQLIVTRMQVIREQLTKFNNDTIVSLSDFDDLPF